MKNLTGVFLIVFFSFIFSGCSIPSKSNQQSNSSNKNNMPTNAIQSTNSKSENNVFAAINTKNGQVILKLYKKEAPNTVANFIKKAESGFYNNLMFHRVEPGFVVQGGDPLGNGTGGGKIKSEINSIPFKRGSIGLARGMDREVSNDSQFFICLSDDGCSHLTNEYVNFGEVVSGIEFIDSIKIGDKILEITDKTK